MGKVVLLLLDDVVDTVEGHTAVVTHDTATAVGIRETGEQVSLADGANFRSVRVEHALVVRLVVVGKNLVEFGTRLVAVLHTSFFGHLNATERHKRALERLVGLQAHDLFQILQGFVDVTGLVARDSRDDIGVHVEDAAVPAFFGLQALQFVPQFLCRVGRAGEEGLITFVGGVVALNKVADVDFALPESAVKAFPSFTHYVPLCSTPHTKISGAEAFVSLLFLVVQYSKFGILGGWFEVPERAVCMGLKIPLVVIVCGSMD